MDDALLSLLMGPTASFVQIDCPHYTAAGSDCVLCGGMPSDRRPPGASGLPARRVTQDSKPASRNGLFGFGMLGSRKEMRASVNSESNLGSGS